MNLKMKPKLDLQLSSNFYMKKLPGSFINELKLDINVNYVINPQLSLQIHRPIENFESNNNFQFSKLKYEFETEILIANVVRIPGKISIFDFQVESLKIQSNSNLDTKTESCHLKGKIETGFMLLNEIIIHNSGEGITKRTDSSCKMTINYSKFSYVKLKFSFKIEMVWDRRMEIIYSSIVTPPSNIPISQWLTSKKKF